MYYIYYDNKSGRKYLTYRNGTIDFMFVKDFNRAALFNYELDAEEALEAMHINLTKFKKRC